MPLLGALLRYAHKIGANMLVAMQSSRHDSSVSRRCLFYVSRL